MLFELFLYCFKLRCHHRFLVKDHSDVRKSWCKPCSGLLQLLVLSTVQYVGKQRQGVVIGTAGFDASQLSAAKRKDSWGRTAHLCTHSGQAGPSASSS